MNRVAACTIITSDYLPYARALAESLQGFVDWPLHVLVDTLEAPKAAEGGAIRVIGLKDLLDDPVAEGIRQKYFETDRDAFRWSMKPIMMKHVMLAHGFDSVFFLDPDLFFFGNPAFLVEQLSEGGMLLSPHWRSFQPGTDRKNFFLNYTDGLFNGGFVGANRRGIEALDWWAAACEFSCERNRHLGQFVDQGHLTSLPVCFDYVRILRHRGCNVANWNRLECSREVSENGEVLIRGTDPIIFVHFTKSTIRGALDGSDPHLAGLLARYEKVLVHHRVAVNPVERLRDELRHRSKSTGRSPGWRGMMGRTLRKAVSLAGRNQREC